MADGEAITKRYEVKDLETGEFINEPLYVLRPQHDNAAFTAMGVYARLCGITHDWITEDFETTPTLSRPPHDSAEWREFLDSSQIDTTGVERSDLLLDPEGLANGGPNADGSAKYMTKMIEAYLGLESLGLLVRKCSAEKQQAAKEWIRRHMGKSRHQEIANILKDCAERRSVAGPYRIANYIHQQCGEGPSGTAMSYILAGHNRPSPKVVQLFVRAFGLEEWEQAKLARAYLFSGSHES